jgi:hypothetical protein
MAYVSDSPNFTDKKYDTVYRKGEVNDESVENVPTDIEKASKPARLLEGLVFPLAFRISGIFTCLQY